MITFVSQYDDVSLKVEFNLHSDATLPDVLEAFESFLYATGYRFDGVVDIINTEDEAFERIK